MFSSFGIAFLAILWYIKKIENHHNKLEAKGRVCHKICRNIDICWTFYNFNKTIKSYYKF